MKVLFDPSVRGLYLEIEPLRGGGTVEEEAAIDYVHGGRIVGVHLWLSEVRHTLPGVPIETIVRHCLAAGWQLRGEGSQTSICYRFKQTKAVPKTIRITARVDVSSAEKCIFGIEMFLGGEGKTLRVGLLPRLRIHSPLPRT